MKDLAQVLAGTVVVPDRRPTYEWASENIDFKTSEAFKGRYNVDNVPWTKGIIDAWDNPFVRMITAVMPPQESGKTIVGQVCLASTITNRPTKCAWNTSTNVKAEQFQDTRWEQTVAACPVLGTKLHPNPHKNKKKRIIFADGTFLLIQGAESDANRQTDSIECQINDECHLWERPQMSEMHERCLAYQETRKILNISVGSDEGTELHDHFMQSSRMEWSHHCPRCQQLFQYVFDVKSPKCTIRFDINAAKVRPDGTLDLTEFEKTVRVVCPQPHCRHEMFYDRDRLAEQNKLGVYVAMNPHANPELQGFHINAFAIGRRPWVKILEPWVEMTIHGGILSREKLRTFIVHALAEFWKDKPIVVSKDLRKGSYTRAEMLKPGGWSEEWIRTMTFDNQRGANNDIEHRWFVARAFSKTGRSRLIDCGRVDEWSELRARQLDLGIPDYTPERPGPWVLGDRRYNGNDVDRVCAEFKWYGSMGHHLDEFVHGPGSEHQGKRLLFSEPRYVDVGFGSKAQGRLHAIYFLWATQRIQDLLGLIREDGASSWDIPSDIDQFCPEYAEHMGSHRQHYEKDKFGNSKRVWKCTQGWPDHLWDCESQQVVLGVMAGVIAPPPPS